MQLSLRSLRFFSLTFFTSSLLALQPSGDFMLSANGQVKVAVHNSILLQINDATLSMMDVKKQMDMIFHQHYGHLENSEQARFQFYETSWRKVFMDLVDNELILADASDKGVKLTEGEIREEIEMRFGPNVLSTLDHIGLTFDEAWKMVKREMTVRRMNWWFVHSKAMQSVTPKEIRSAYKAYLQEHPAYKEFSYRIISLKKEKDLALFAEKISSFLENHSSKDPSSLEEELKKIDPQIQVSSLFQTSDQEIAKSHLEILSELDPLEYSKALIQKGRDQKEVARFFYLVEKKDFPAPNFEEISSQLREQLIQKAVIKESTAYLNKLRKHYGFDDKILKECAPDDLHPFSLQ